MYKDIVKSNAKLNIGLNVYDKRDDNYHNIDSIFIPINLYDELEINYSGKIGNIVINTESTELIDIKQNIIYKIYEEFYSRLKSKIKGAVKQEIIVKLKKNIPTLSGLGGGSSNGAFFLKSINRYYNNVLTIEELVELSKNISADIPFFLYNTPSRVTGMGHVLEKIDINLRKNIILIKPNFGISTKQAYQNIKYIENIKYADINKIIKALKFNDIKVLEENIENVIEQALFKNSKIIKFKEKFKRKFKDIEINMSGSGSCFYIFDNYHYNLIEELKNIFPNYFIIKCKLV